MPDPDRSAPAPGDAVDGDDRDGDRNRDESGGVDRSTAGTRPAGLTAAQRRRLEAVFGDVLPATTGDERDPGGEREPASAEERYLADRPPHHDRER